MYHLGMALVEVNSVWKSYPRRAGLRTELRHAVEDVSLTIESGETLGLVGESGSGKTTLARMILGLAEPSRGSVRVDGTEVARASAGELRRVRRQMQPVFQDPYAALHVAWRRRVPARRLSQGTDRGRRAQRSPSEIGRAHV